MKKLLRFLCAAAYTSCLSCMSLSFGAFLLGAAGWGVLDVATMAIIGLVGGAIFSVFAIPFIIQVEDAENSRPSARIGGAELAIYSISAAWFPGFLGAAVLGATEGLQVFFAGFSGIIAVGTVVAAIVGLGIVASIVGGIAGVLSGRSLDDDDDYEYEFTKIFHKSMPNTNISNSTSTNTVSKAAPSLLITPQYHSSGKNSSEDQHKSIVNNNVVSSTLQ